MFFDGDIVIVFDGRRFGIEKLSENIGDRTEMGDLVSTEFHIAMAIKQWGDFFVLIKLN